MPSLAGEHQATFSRALTCHENCINIPSEGSLQRIIPLFEEHPSQRKRYSLSPSAER